MSGLLKDSTIDKFELNGYTVREEHERIYLRQETRTGLSTKEVEIDCAFENGKFRVICGDEINHGEWYDLWREELNQYQKDINDIYSKEGIWFV